MMVMVDSQRNVLKALINDIGNDGVVERSRKMFKATPEVKGKAAEIIMDEIKNGTPNTSQRVETIERADSVFRQWLVKQAEQDLKTFIDEITNEELNQFIKSYRKAGSETDVRTALFQLIVNARRRFCDRPETT